MGGFDAVVSTVARREQGSTGAGDLGVGGAGKNGLTM